MSSTRQLAVRNELVNWQVAPADWEIANYDEPKVRYRREVEEFLKPLPLRSLKKKTFVTISTNVLCADIASSKDTNDPIERDLYLPLEIALSKWSVSDSGAAQEERAVSTRVWMINPGPPITGSNKYAVDQRKEHKIDYTNIRKNDIYFRNDLANVAKEINAMFTPDRTVFSIQLRNCRQDLGCLKWLNNMIEVKIKPIKVYSLEDLYVVLIRRILVVEDAELKRQICQGVARSRMSTANTYDTKRMCFYHRDSSLADSDNDTGHCARAVAESYSHVLLDDVNFWTSVLQIAPTLDANNDIAATEGH